MTIKINFDATHNSEEPTIVLAKKNGDKIGKINAKSIEVVDSLNDASEITFNVYKYIDNVKDNLWDEIVNFKLVYCVEWNMWFEITVELDETTETMKTVFCTQLGQAELSQIMLYNIQINTEDDIARDEYEIPTVLYYPEHPEASLLHRIMEKAPHYSVRHVDNTIAKIQRTFEFDDTSIYDAFEEISEEIHCLFVLDSNSDANGNIKRTVSVYDLESNCFNCGHRGEFTLVCPECNNENIDEGYGEDTTIFIATDEFAEDVQLTTDTDSVKNCFKLEAGDDLMTATIRNCNPNGTDYIWYLSDEMKEDMSKELAAKIDSYDSLYSYYQNDYIANLDSTTLSSYNKLIDKYKAYNNKLQKIANPIRGYPSIMNAYYNTIDLELYLKSELMPTVIISSTNATKEISKLTVANLSPVSTNNIENISVATADNVVLSIAKVLVDSRYKIKIADGSYLSEINADQSSSSGYRVWTGRFIVTNYSDEEDTATSGVISINVNDNYKNFVQQKIDKALSQNDVEDMSITGLFDKGQTAFVSELKKYSLNRLSSFYDACQTCIDILIEQGVGDKQTWSGKNPNLYNDLYIPYLNKLDAIESEMSVRQSEIDLIVGVYDADGTLKKRGLQTYIEETQKYVQNNLNFEDYLGSNLWLEFCSFRREDKYSNDNYISDGLNNADLFKKAYEFVKTAQNEIYKSAELQHSISANLKNLLAMKKFKPLINSFEIGNWIRVMADDEVYKLRLIEYSIDYDDFESISVEFSDTVKVNSTVKSVQEILDQSSSMATSYDSVKRQAKQGEQSSSTISNWTDIGLNATNIKIIGGADGQSQSWDNHGMLFREYDSVSGEYSPEQMKIVNSTIAITDDNWQTTKTAVGKYYYIDPITNETKSAYGVNGDTIIGKLVLGESLLFSNKSGNLSFDNDSGLVAVNTDNNKKVVINPEDSASVFKIQKKNNGNFQNVLAFGEDGNLVITGEIIASKLTLLSGASVESGELGGFADVAISGSYNDLSDKPTLFSGNYNDLSNRPKLKTVATSGSYNDLSDKPTLFSGNYNDLSNRPALKTVATSGKYTDLIGSVSDAGKILYTDTDGAVTVISVSELKTLLGL